jgi:hypothetical protein
MTSIQSYFIDAVIQFNQAKTQARIWLNETRADYPVVNILCSAVIALFNLVKNVFLYLTRIRIEPSDEGFISKYYYDPTTKQTCEYVYAFNPPDLSENMNKKYHAYTNKKADISRLFILGLVRS